MSIEQIRTEGGSGLRDEIIEKGVFKSKTEEAKDNPEVVKVAVDELASAFHEDWRKTRRNEDGTFEPREKSTTDEDWIAKHGTNTVDIANTTYMELPADWQAENKAAAEVIVEIINRELMNDPYRMGYAYTNSFPLKFGDNMVYPNEIDMIGNKIHSKWLERNDWAKGGELDVWFGDLPFSEQQKDINQFQIAAELFTGVPIEQARLETGTTYYRVEQAINFYHSALNPDPRMGMDYSPYERKEAEEKLKRLEESLMRASREA